jgi:hypothetical protein
MERRAAQLTGSTRKRSPEPLVVGSLRPEALRGVSWLARVACWLDDAVNVAAVATSFVTMVLPGCYYRHGDRPQVGGFVPR